MASNLFDEDLPEYIPELGLVRNKYNGLYYEATDLDRQHFEPPPPVAKPEPQQPEAMTPEWSDYGRLVMRGGAQLGQGAGWVMRMLGLEDSGKAIETLGSDAVDYWTERLTPAMQKELAKQFIVQNPETGEYEWGDASLRTVAGMGAESVLGTMAGMGVGGVLFKTGAVALSQLSPVLKAFGNPVGRKVLQDAVRLGAGAAPGTREATLAIAAAKKLAFIDKTMAALGAASFGIGEGAVSLAGSGASAYEMVRNMDPAKLAQNERYRQVFDSTDETMSWEERHQYAADTVAMEASTVAGFQAGLTTSLLGAPMGAFFGRLIGKSAQSALSATPLRAMATGMAGEAAQEFGQSGTEQYIANRAAIGAGDTELDPWKDVLNQAVGGAAAGALMGGGFGLFEARRPEQRTQTAPTAPGAPQTGAAATPPPGTPPVSTGPTGPAGGAPGPTTATPTGPTAPTGATGATPPAPPSVRTEVVGVPFKYSVYHETDGTFSYTTKDGAQVGGFASEGEAQTAAEQATAGAKPSAEATPGAAEKPTITIPEGGELSEDGRKMLQDRITLALSEGVDPVRLQETVNAVSKRGQFLFVLKNINSLRAEAAATDATPTDATPTDITPQPVGGESVREPIQPQAPAGEGKPGYIPEGERSGPEPPPPTRFSRKAFRGTGRSDRGSVYNNPDSPPILGQGEYFAFDQKHAETFGPRVEESQLDLENPLVITSDEQWKALSKEAGWEFPNPTGLPIERQREMTSKLQELVRQRGHDGIVIDFDANYEGDILPDGRGIKTLRNVFDVPQAVRFQKEAPALPKIVQELIAAGPESAAQARGEIQDVRMNTDREPNRGGWEFTFRGERFYTGDTNESPASAKPDSEEMRSWLVRQMLDGKVESLGKAGWPEPTAEKKAEYVEKLRQAFALTAKHKAEQGGTGMYDPGRENLRERKVFDEVVEALQKEHGLSYPEAQKAALEYAAEARKAPAPEKPKKPTGGKGSTAPKKPTLPERVAFIKRMVQAFEDENLEDTSNAIIGDLQKKHGLTLEEAEKLAIEYETEAKKQVEKEQAKAEKKAERERKKAEKEAAERPKKVEAKRKRFAARAGKELPTIKGVLEALTQEGGFRKNAEPAVVAQLDEWAAEAADDIEKEAWESVKAEVTASDKPAQVLWEGLEKAARKEQERIDKEQYRKPEVYEAALKAALEKAGIPVDSEDARAFRAGWDHMLAGRTASSLTGDNMKARREGYDAAKKWTGIPEGKAWYEGKPEEKVGGTGIRVKRRIDEVAREVEKLTSLEEAWKVIEKAVTRVVAFQPVLGKNATPGTKRYVESLRNAIKPLKGYLKKRVFYLPGYTFEAVLQKYGKLPDSDTYKQSMLAAAKDYVAQLEILETALEGVESVNDAAARITSNYVKLDGNFYRSTDASNALGNFMIQRSAWWRPFVTPLPGQRAYGQIVTALSGSEDAPAEPKTKSIRRPRLDKVVRNGRPDVRKGADVKPQEFKDRFGFGDVDMGDWNTSREAKDALNYAYDAFTDLADFLGIPYKAIGFGGQLYFSVGRTGMAGAAAHFHPEEKVENPGPNDPVTVPNINITKKNGDGSLCHEWFHALDFFNGTESTTKKPNNPNTKVLGRRLKFSVENANLGFYEKRVLGYLRGTDHWYNLPDTARPIEHAMAWLRAQTWSATHTDFFKDAERLETGKWYWSNDMELLARAAEAYVNDRMMGLDIEERAREGGPPVPAMNNFLVNPAYVGDNVIRPPLYRGRPYPAGEERQALNDVLAAWTALIEVKNGVPTLPTTSQLDHLDPETIWENELETFIKERVPELEKQVAEEKAEAEKKSEEERKAAEAKAEEERKKAEEEERKRREEAGEQPGKTVEAIRRVEAYMDISPGPMGTHQGWFTMKQDLVKWAAATKTKLTPELHAQIDANWQAATGQGEPTDIPAIWENLPTPEEGLPPKEDSNELSDDEIDALIDDAIDNLEQEQDETEPAEPKPKKERKPKQPGMPRKPREAKPRGEKPAAEKPEEDEIGKLAKEAKGHAKKAIDEAVKGLDKLFGASSKGKLNSLGIGVDAETYRQAKPHFETMYEEAKATGKTLAKLISAMVARWQAPIKPYLAQWIKDHGIRHDLSRRLDANGKPVSTQTQPGATPEQQPGEQGGTGSAPQGPGERGGTPLGEPGATGAGEDTGGGAGPTTGAGTGAGRPGGQPGEPGGLGAGEGDGEAVGPGAGRGGDTTAGEPAGAEPGEGGETPAGEPLVDELFAPYEPQKVRIEGAQPHPGDLVESAAMSSIPLPEPTYVPDLPEETIRDGKLSIAQLEPIIYGNMNFQQFLPGGKRKGYAIGDGTGVGKGREIAGFIMDQWRRGNKKHIWITEKPELAVDALRDILGVGLEIPIMVYDSLPPGWPKADDPGYRRPKVQDQKYSEIKDFPEGVIILTYKRMTLADRKSRVKLRSHLQNWAGKGYEGMLVFDEAHALAKSFDPKDMSLQAKETLDFEDLVPMARVLYVSATMATNPENMSYLTRLGLWGDKTPFSSAGAFVESVIRLGKAAMETVARDMKAMGLYLARSLSYRGVNFTNIQHDAAPDERALYDKTVALWNDLRVDMEFAIEQAGIDPKMGVYWGAHQRFFNLFITALATKTTIEKIKEVTEGENGGTAVIQLVNHYGAGTEEKAKQKQALEAAGMDEEAEDISLSMSPMEIAIKLVKDHYPIYEYEQQTTVDKNGKTKVVWVPILDANGKEVVNDARKARYDSLLERLQRLSEDHLMPENPVNMIVEAFGENEVVEVTGRPSRHVYRRQPDGSLVRVEEKRNADIIDQELKEFREDRRRILIFSEKGGTGFSYHASLDPRNKNTRQRHHFVLQAGWKADKAFQGMGRTHRTFQKQPPIYYLVKTDIEAQARFVSSIANRLSKMGSLVMGERHMATGKGETGLFRDDEDLHSEYGMAALNSVFFSAFHGHSGIMAPPELVSEVENSLEHLLNAADTDPKKFAAAFNVLRNARSTDDPYSVGRRIFAAADVIIPALDPRRAQRMRNRFIADLAIIVKRYRAAVSGTAQPREVDFNELMRMMGQDPVQPGDKWRASMTPSMDKFLNRSLGLSVSGRYGTNSVMSQLFEVFNTTRQNLIQAARDADEYDEGLETIHAVDFTPVIDKVIYTQPESGVEARYQQLEVEQKEQINTFDEVNGVAIKQGPSFLGYFRDNATGKVFALISRLTGKAQRWDTTTPPRVVDNAANIEAAARAGMETTVQREGPTYTENAFNIRKERPFVTYSTDAMVNQAEKGGADSLEAFADKEILEYRKNHTEAESELMESAINRALAEVRAAAERHAPDKDDGSKALDQPVPKGRIKVRAEVRVEEPGGPATFWATELIKVYNERGPQAAQEWVAINKTNFIINKEPLMVEAIEEAWQKIQAGSKTAVAGRKIVHYTKLDDPDVARAEWGKSLAAAPKTKKVTYHLSTGITLPIWDKFAAAKRIRVAKIRAGAKEIVGRILKEPEVDALLKALNVNIVGEMPAKQLMERIFRGQVGTLANGLALYRDDISGSRVIRLQINYNMEEALRNALHDPNSAERIVMQSKGVKVRQTQTTWGETRTTLYIESGNTKTFEWLLSWSPMVKLAGNLQQPSASRALPRDGGVRKYDTKVSRVREWIAPLVKELGSVVRFEVVQSVSDLGDDSIESNTEGVYWTGTNVVTLIADMLPNQKRAAMVAIHEVFGHLAAEAHPLFEQALTAVIRLQLMGHKRINELWKEVAKTQPTLDRRSHAKEVLALIAEKDIELTAMDKLRNKVRELLRKVFPSLQWTDREINGFVKNAGKALIQRAQAANAALEKAAERGDREAQRFQNELYYAVNGPWIDEPMRRGETMTDEEWLGTRAHLDRSYSRAATMDSDTAESFKNTFGKSHEPLSLRDHARGWVERFKNIEKRRLVQGVVDAYHSVKLLEEGANGGEVMDASESAWKAMLATRNHASVMAAIMVKGIPKLVDGVYQAVAGRKGFLEILQPLVDHPDGNLIDHWQLWAAANRAQRLIGEDKESRMEQEDIRRGLALEQRYPFFRDVFNDWTKFNEQALDMAVEAGILGKDSRRLWEKDDYVPFYRVLEDLDVMSPGKKRGFSGQKAMIKALKGGEAAVNDIIENMVMNTSSLVDRSFKNIAMQRVVALAEGNGMTRIPKAVQMATYSEEQVERALAANGINLDQMTPARRNELVKLFRRVAPRGDNVVSVYERVVKTDRQGNVTSDEAVPIYYEVDDPLLLRSIVGLGADQISDVFKMFTGAKRLLTATVTADPGFMARNLIRDTLANWIQSGIKGNPLKGAIKGVVSSWKQDEAVWKIMMAGGGGGGFYDSNPEDIKKLLKDHVPAHQMNGFLDSIVSPKRAWKAWQRVGSATENANRLAVYEAVKKAGGTEAEAIYQARDVLNFTMSGDHVVVRHLIATVPFMNARIQGLYRLARGYQANHMTFLIRGISLMAATMALMAANLDDDEYEELPQWDKDIYWHIFLPADENGKREHFRIPKPFELGILFATIPERLFRVAHGDDSGKVFARSMARALADTLAFNPIPQLVKPAIEQYANRSMFTGSAIVGFAEQNLKPEQQYTPWTSETMRVMAKLMPDFLGEWVNSPRRMEHMVRAYTGAIGMYALSASDWLVRNLGDFPEAPTSKVYDMPVISSFVRDPDARITRYSDELYEMLDEANALYSSIRRLNQSGQREEAMQMRKENIEKLQARGSLNKIAANVRKINNQIRLVMVSNLDPDAKRERIDALTERKNDQMRRIQRFEQAF